MSRSQHPVLPGLMQDYPLTVGMLLERMGELHGHKTLTTRRADQFEQSTYAALIGRVHRLAGALHGLGVARGARVSTLMWNGPEHLEAHLAVPAMGAVLHTVNARLAPASIGRVLEQTAPHVVLVEESLADVLLAVPLPSSVRAVLVADCRNTGHAWPAPARGAPRWLRYEDLLAQADRRYFWPALDERSACGICHTSGTTGAPKGVVYSHRSTVLHAMSCLYADGIGLRERDTCLPVVPLFHAHGWGFPYASCLAGASLAFSHRNSDPAALAELIERAGVTVATAVPTVWINLLEQLRSGAIPAARLQTLRHIPIGGAVVPGHLIDGYAEFGIHVRHCWGMTEASPLGLVSMRRSELSDTEWVAARAHQGIAPVGCQVRVVTDTGVVAPRDGKTVGELQLRGAWVADSYYAPDKPGLRNDAQAFDTDSDGRRWLKTGDMAWINALGYVHIVDRAKDLIKSGGEWISSQDLETALMEHPAVCEAAVVAVPDDIWQERPMAYLSLTHQPECGTPNFAAYLETRFPRWQIPERFVVLLELPKGTTGKVDKAQLRILAASPRGHAGKGR
ncbi:MAG TPA: long-chain-fatty-acid--CoA ligase [Bordetella sp.]|nr:long-chain-fatty-acid--CoA ligase [Bordetella sp.]